MPLQPLVPNAEQYSATTEAMCWSEVSATAKANSGSAASEVSTKPSNGILSFSKSESSKIAIELVRSAVQAARGSISRVKLRPFIKAIPLILFNLTAWGWPWPSGGRDVKRKTILGV